MGVPTVTLAGDTLVSRQGASLLACAGLDDWIAVGADDYVARALAHATDIDDLVRLRSTLRQEVLTSPLFDAARFARNLEAALEGMWQRRCH
jgi:predicted O-linked N-acetylglucosamine transferase (SPINDLY family)